MRLTDKRGAPFWARLEVTRRPTLEGTAARVAIIDVDEQRRAEQERRRSDARFETLFQCSNDALLTLSPPTWRVTSANPAALALFGARKSDELASVALWDHAAPGARGSASHGAVLPAVIDHEGAHRYEWTLKRLSGESFPASISLSHAELEGEPVLLAAVRDESEANATRGALAQADRVNSMGLLAASVAHEINNPLTYVLVMIESLAKWLPELAQHLPELSRKVHDRLGAQDAEALLGAYADLLRVETLRDMSDRAEGALDATRRIRNIAMALGTFARTDDKLDQVVDLHRSIRSALEMAGNEIRHRAPLCVSLEAAAQVRGSEGQLSRCS